MLQINFISISFLRALDKSLIYHSPIPSTCMRKIIQKNKIENLNFAKHISKQMQNVQKLYAVSHKVYTFTCMYFVVQGNKAPYTLISHGFILRYSYIVYFDAYVLYFHIKNSTLCVKFKNLNIVHVMIEYNVKMKLKSVQFKLCCHFSNILHENTYIILQLVDTHLYICNHDVVYIILLLLYLYIYLYTEGYSV